MIVPIWFIVVGALLVLIALLGSTIERLPISTGLIYMVIGFALGASGVGLLPLDLQDNVDVLEHVFEIAVLISLFAVGLKLRAPLPRGAWGLTTRLAVGAMGITIAATMVFSHMVIGLSWSESLLLAAILAPTDPVLASDVQINDPDDRDRVRFGLTAEGGLNDITAFPFVFLALGLLGLRDIGPWGMQWFAVDVMWAATSAVGIGWISGRAVGHLALRVRDDPNAPLGLEEFLTLGVIALSYGLALLVHGLGFLAVFAAGLAMRRSQPQGPTEQAREDTVERETPNTSTSSDEPSTQLDAAEPTLQPVRVVQEALVINERVERIAEVVAVLLLGGLISAGVFSTKGLWIAAALIFVIRPAAVAISLIGTDLTLKQKILVGWFGIRGVGSLYYLMFAVGVGVAPESARHIAELALAAIAASVVVHGMSATPLMRLYRKAGR
ncbi:MAG TPA: cation:proton antiporter [Burkholderiaceae bacterium]|nr:cation:proton antiporter [Burkholderiaceae bacterium]